MHAYRPTSLHLTSCLSPSHLLSLCISPLQERAEQFRKKPLWERIARTAMLPITVPLGIMKKSAKKFGRMARNVIVVLMSLLQLVVDIIQA